MNATVATSDVIQFYVNWAVGPSVVFAPYLFLALRLPLRTVTYLLALSTFFVFVIASLMLVVKEQAPTTLDDEQRAAVANHIAGAAALVLLTLAFLASRTGRATPRKIRLVGLAIAMSPAIALFTQGTVVSDVVQFMIEAARDSQSARGRLRFERLIPNDRIVGAAAGRMARRPLDAREPRAEMNAATSGSRP